MDLCGLGSPQGDLLLGIRWFVLLLLVGQNAGGPLVIFICNACSIDSISPYASVSLAISSLPRP